MEYALTLNREPPNDEDLSEQEDLLQTLPGYHFPVRASKLSSTKQHGAKKKARVEDSEEENEETSSSSMQDFNSKLKVIRIMMNIAFMR